MNEHGYCPACNADLDGESIYLSFIQKGYFVEKAQALAAMYETSKWGRHIALYDRRKDRTVAYQCPDCKHIYRKD
jgi:hypothetical protein